jgi:hypothetical protein
MSKTKYHEFLSKPEISFWVPIIFTAITVTSSFFMLSTKVELLNQKVDNLTEKIEYLTDKYASVESRYGQMSLKVQRIETSMGIER